MQYLVIGFGWVIILSGLVLAVIPEKMLDFLSRHGQSTWLYATAIGVRIVLGLALVLYAPNTAFSLALSILGWLALIAALVLLIMRRSGFQRLLAWVTSFATPYAIPAGAVSILFGCFLIYAAA